MLHFNTGKSPAIELDEAALRFEIAEDHDCGIPFSDR